MRPRSLALAAALAVPALALTGCAADDTTGAAGDAITVNATDTACTVSRTSVPAGQVEFTVTNAGSKVNEFYVYAENDRIVGEVENISPGLTRTFHVDLSDPGTYQTACKPGMVGDGIRADFTVTGSAAAAPTGFSRVALAAAGLAIPFLGEARLAAGAAGPVGCAAFHGLAAPGGHSAGARGIGTALERQVGFNLGRMRVAGHLGLVEWIGHRVLLCVVSMRSMYARRCEAAVREMHRPLRPTSWLPSNSARSASPW